MCRFYVRRPSACGLWQTALLASLEVRRETNNVAHHYTFSFSRWLVGVKFYPTHTVEMSPDIASLARSVIYDRSCERMLFNSSLSFMFLKMALPLP